MSIQTLFKDFRFDKAIKSFSFKWLAIWSLIMGAYAFGFRSFGITYLSNAPVTVIYFLLSAWLGYRYFGLSKRISSIKNLRRQMLFAFLSTVLFYLSTIVMANTIPMGEANRAFVIKSDFLFPLLRLEVTLSKLAEIIFQQTYILALILFLKNKINDKKGTIIVFTSIFFILHLPLFFIFQEFSLIFTIPSLFAGIVFSFLILTFDYGIFYSFVFHKAFYLLLAVVLRLYPF